MRRRLLAALILLAPPWVGVGCAARRPEVEVLVLNRPEGGTPHRDTIPSGTEAVVIEDRGQRVRLRLTAGPLRGAIVEVPRKNLEIVD